MECLLALAEAAALPESARNPIGLLAGQFRDTQLKIEDVTVEIRKAAGNDEVARRLQGVPGIGPITSSVLAATLLDVTNFKAARDLAAWLGLTRDTAFERRQGTPGKDMMDGKQVYPAAALSRRTGHDHRAGAQAGRRGLASR